MSEEHTHQPGAFDSSEENEAPPTNETRAVTKSAAEENKTTSEVFRNRKLVPKVTGSPVLEEPPRPTPPQDTMGSLFFGAVVGISAGVGAFAIVAGIVLMIIVPPWYRSLEPRYQAVWCNRVSLLCDLKNERETEGVYALGDNEAELAATARSRLLSSTTPTADATVTSTPSLTPTRDVTSSPVEITAETNQATSTPNPTASPTPSPSPSQTPIPLPRTSTLELSNLDWEQQGWNNCGPTTITIGLTYFGYEDNQYRAARYLKPNPEDTNVSPNQLIEFVNASAGSELGVRALYRVGGTPDILRRLIVNNFPVIIERGIVLEEEGWMGHYSLVVGYDDTAQEYLFFDSWYGYAQGEGRRFDMAFIEEGWKQFNYTFIVIYPLQRQNELYAILGDYADYQQSARIAANIAREQAMSNPDDMWAWFNWGTSLTMLGEYENAVDAYDFARTLDWPFRMMWYQFGPYIAYYNVGRYDDVLGLALAAERTTPYVEEIYYYRGLVYAAQGNANSAIFQFDRALQYNANFDPAEVAKTAVLQGRFSPPSAG